MNKEIQENWFVDWFNSNYYQLLYNHRDHSEAEKFINSLFQHLNIPKDNTKVLDLACGVGRHALQVHKLGYDVLGIDLSRESISTAKKFEEKGLSFKVGDMRSLHLKSEIDLVLNLFTSFGYFKEKGEDKEAVRSMADSLKTDGILVMDYLNVEPVIETLPTFEEINKKGIAFNTKKFIEDGFIVKNIEFRAEGKDHHHREYVKIYTLDDFKTLFNSVGLEIVKTFGNYQLGEFEDNSERLIMKVKKIS